MKTFEQLSDTELLELTEEQISDFIKLKKAEQGIKILSEPTMPTSRDLPEVDTVTYEVSGMFFLEKEAAEEICEVINKHAHKQRDVSYDYNINRDYYYEKPKSYTTLQNVTINKVYSQATFDSIKETLKSNAMIKKSYESVMDEYKEEESKATDIINSVYDQIQNAKNRIEQFKEYKTRIVDYIKLANGVTDIAWNFFDKAYSVETSVKAMIMESDEYKEAIKCYINA